ncbi:MAG: translation initiation factor IF-2 [Lachnospiraceae bacterium]|nr:translation initiation factor IF-2 [Lachnospiraceae bacterium]
MAKMKVHELAKELDIQSKDILSFLQGKGIEAKAAQSSIEDDAIAMVKKQFGKAEAPKAEAPKAEAPKAEAPKAEAPKAEAPKAAPQGEAPKKKKSIIIVGGNAQGQRPQGQRPQGGPNNRPQGQRPQGGPNNRPQGQRPANNNNNNNNYRPLIKVRPGALDRVHNNEPEEVIETKPVVETVPETVSAPANNSEEPKRTFLSDIRTEQRPQQNNQSERSERPAGNDRRDNRNDRPQRNQGGNRDGQRNNADRRPSNGERKPFQNNGERGNFNKDGQRNNNDRRPQGQGQRPQGQGGASRISFAGPQAAPNFGSGKPGADRRDDKRKNKGFDAKESEKKQSDKRKNQERDNRKNHNFMMDDEDLETKRRKGKFIKPEKAPVVEEVIKVISVDETITIKDLADKMKIQAAQIVKKLFLQGQIVNVNSEITFEEAENIAIEYEIICEKEVKVDVIEELLKEEEEDTANMKERPPVVCVMGHVDHGKTSLLDAIRKTNVTDREAGGITQAIGAYTVHIKDRDITFLDTPGHEAFTEMRMRGAKSTDIAVLVVAADDGVMPQTIEAINHAKAAGVEVIVAVNKIDKPAADPERVKQELTQYELIPSDWGGSTEFVNISAKKGDGIDDLLETILLTADVLELKADPDRMARGLVIEAELDKGRGPVATVLVQKGTLKVGDFVSAGATNGKVRAMINDKGKNVKVAGPSIPVEILGLNGVPNAGEVFIAHPDDKTAKSYAETFIAQNKEKKLEEIKAKMSLDDLFSKIQEGNLKELNIIVKADVMGSVEAVKQSLSKLSNEEVVVKCIHGGVGAINESDVTLASASNAIIIGFNVRTDAVAKATAEREGVEIKLYKVIYQAIEDVQAAMKGMLAPVYEEKIIGHAEVRQIFKASAIGNIAGSYVLDGMFQRGCKVRITREGEQIYEGELQSLKRFKDDVKEVKAGFECGLVFDGFDAMQELDIVEAYIMVEVPR